MRAVPCLLLWAFGCGALDDSAADASDGAPGYEPIMAWDQWTALTEDDPYEVDAGVALDCAARALHLDADSLQQRPDNPDGWVPTIVTSSCPFVTATQPSLRAIDAGERLQAAIFHTKLYSMQPAQARVSVRIGDDVVLEQRLAIATEAPADDCPATATDGFCGGSGRVAGTWTADRRLPAGTPLYFHVDNHGDNEYWLVELRPSGD